MAHYPSFIGVQFAEPISPPAFPKTPFRSEQFCYIQCKKQGDSFCIEGTFDPTDTPLHGLALLLPRHVSIPPCHGAFPPCVVPAQQSTDLTGCIQPARPPRIPSGVSLWG